MEICRSWQGCDLPIRKLLPRSVLWRGLEDRLCRQELLYIVHFVSSCYVCPNYLGLQRQLLPRPRFFHLTGARSSRCYTASFASGLHTFPGLWSSNRRYVKSLTASNTVHCGPQSCPPRRSLVRKSSFAPWLPGFHQAARLVKAAVPVAGRTLATRSVPMIDLLVPVLRRIPVEHQLSISFAGICRARLESKRSPSIAAWRVAYHNEQCLARFPSATFFT